MQARWRAAVFDALWEVVLRILEARPIGTRGRQLERCRRLAFEHGDELDHVVAYLDAHELEGSRLAGLDRATHTERHVAPRRQPQFLDDLTARVRTPMPAQPIESARGRIIRSENGRGQKRQEQDSEQLASFHRPTVAPRASCG